MDASLQYSEDGGATFETVDEFSLEPSGEVRSLPINLSSLPNTKGAQFRLEVSDGESAVSATTPVFWKNTPRQSSNYVEHVEGDGGAVISINFVMPDLLTNHRYRIDFEVAQSGAIASPKSTDQIKTYAVSDLDLDVELFSGFPVSERESPMFDGIRLSITDTPKIVDAEKTGWIVGDTGSGGHHFIQISELWRLVGDAR